MSNCLIQVNNCFWLGSIISANLSFLLCFLQASVKIATAISLIIICLFKATWQNFWPEPFFFKCKVAQEPWTHGAVSQLAVVIIINYMPLVNFFAEKGFSRCAQLEGSVIVTGLLRNSIVINRRVGSVIIQPALPCGKSLSLYAGKVKAVFLFICLLVFQPCGSKLNCSLQWSGANIQDNHKNICLGKLLLDMISVCLESNELDLCTCSLEGKCVFGLLHAVVQTHGTL